MTIHKTFLLQQQEEVEKFTFIDLFAGIGGLRLPFDELGGKCVLSSEIDKYAQKTYQSYFNHEPKGDICKLLLTEIPDFDLLVGGFPCQPFSQAGQKKGFDDTRGTLFFEIENILKTKKPKAFLLENVKGLKGHDKGNTFRVIKNKLISLGYYSDETIKSIATVQTKPLFTTLNKIINWATNNNLDENNLDLSIESLSTTVKKVTELMAYFTPHLLNNTEELFRECLKEKFTTVSIAYNFPHKNLLLKGVPGTGKSQTISYRDDKKVIEDNLLRRFDVVEIYSKYDESIYKSKDIPQFLELLNNKILERFETEMHPDRFSQTPTRC